MKQNITIRKRKSAKHGVTYEYRFETASIGGQRKWISKGGFLDEKIAAEDACRIEHHISNEAMAAIKKFVEN